MLRHGGLSIAVLLFNNCVHDFRPEIARAAVAPIDGLV
jgi:hypothetical protein